MEIKKSIFFKLWTNLAQMSAIILIISLISSIAYYKRFNIKIESFASLSDLSLFVSSDLLIAVPGCIIMILLISSDSKVKKRQSTVETPLVKPTKIQKIKNVTIATIGIFLLTSVLIYGLYTFYCVYIKGGPYYQQIAGIGIIGVIIGLAIVVYTVKTNKRMDNDSVYIIFFSMFFIFFYSNMLSDKIYDAENGLYKGTQIITDKVVYVSSDTCYYIGQTSSFIFIYHTMDRHTTVLPVGEIKKMEMHIHTIKNKNRR